jgi:D-alanyl-D-alanine carboxypeptidase/D-alanyl-D-alanine-endopeptidase (penicillin-binding protein 4)
MRMHTLRRSLVAAGILTLAAMLAGGSTGVAVAGPVSRAASSADDAALTAVLNQIFADARFSGATAAVQVRDGATGAVVYARGADQRVIPASNEKLMTSAAALELLGTGYQFHTTASYSGTKSGTAVKGNLYLKGQGDPTATGAVYDQIATAVAKAGIRTVTGNLVADDSWFDRTQLGLDWSWEDETYASTAGISALTIASTADFDTGSVAVQSRPGAAAGKPGVLAVVPATSYVTIVNHTVTGKAGSAESVSAVRVHGTNTITVSGSVPLKAARVGVDLVSVQDPTLLTASVFRDALAKRGVKVNGKIVVAGSPSGTKKIVDHPSITLGALLIPFLKLSNNGHAELLTKAMGRRSSGRGTGSWSAGLAEAAAALGRMGVNSAAIRMGDGSGLSRRDWLTTEQVAGLLQAAQAKPWFTTWYNALPIAAHPDRLIGGTLTGRMGGTPAALNLHGKTGTLTGVNALSGYVNDRSGRRLVFSIVSNNALASVADLLDKAAVALAGSGAGAAGLSARELPPIARQVVTRDGEDVECSWMRAC